MLNVAAPLRTSIIEVGRRELRSVLVKTISYFSTNRYNLSYSSILILTKPEGDKFKYARKWKIPCVSSEWIFDSIEKGYCLPTEKYRIESS
jgi:topoisomerase (DNA) II binding protein 1